MNDKLLNEPLMNYFQWASCNENNYTSEAYANYHTLWHLKQAEKVVCDEAVTGFDSARNVTVDKQSITNAFENYIKDNIK